MHRIHHQPPHLRHAQHHHEVQHGPHAHGAHGPRASAATQSAATARTGFVAGARGTQAPVTSSGRPSDALPAPGISQSSPPAGQGLTKGNAFGANAIETAGGYTIVPTGKDQGWDIFAPGQKPGETPNSHIWGDPHVQEADGTHWDFTRNSNFRLPDGTNIAVGTTKQEGYALSSTLDITNGQDRVQVSGIDVNKPVVGDITHDGYQARADLANQDTFLLGGDKSHVQWFKETNGKIDGEVVSAAMTTTNGVQAYEQSVKADSQYVVDPSLQPKVGTAAWGNMLRDQAVDVAHDTFGAKSTGADLMALGANVDHQQNTAEALANRFYSQLQALMNLMKLLDVSTSSRNLRPVSGR
jgi:hypothetical protein